MHDEPLPSELQYPSPQLMHEVAPASEYFPAGQILHSDCPVLGLNLPASQLKQEDDEVPPVFGLYEPIPQAD